MFGGINKLVYDKALLSLVYFDSPGRCFADHPLYAKA